MLEKIKSGLVKAGKWSSKAIGQAGDNARYNSEITVLKEEILEKLTVKELKGLRRKYNITFSEEMLFDDRKFTKEDYVENLAKKFKLGTLKGSVKNKNFLNDVNRREREIEEVHSKLKEERWKQEETSPEEAIEEENPLLNDLLDTLKEMYLPDKILDERELQNTLFTSLKNNAQYSYAKEEVIIDKSRPDIIIDDTVIELKFIRNKNNAKNKLREAASQAQEYEDISFVKNVILFLYVGDEAAELVVNDYVNDHIGKRGIQTVIKLGGTRKARVKRVYPNIWVSYKKG